MSDGRKKLSAFEQLKSLVKGKKKETAGSSRQTGEKNPESGQSKRHSGGQQHYNSQSMRTPQYGQKMARQTQNPRLEVKPQEAVTVSVNIQDQMEVESRRLFGWLCRNFPNCFSPKSKRPLKVGINDDIVKAFLERTHRQIHFGVLTRVLRRYVGDQAYQKAILEHQKRYNLLGEAIEEISAEHLEHAEARLEELKEKARLRAAGIDPRTVMNKKDENTESDKAELAVNLDDASTEAELSNEKAEIEIDTVTVSEQIENEPKEVKDAEDEKETSKEAQIGSEAQQEAVKHKDTNSK